LSRRISETFDALTTIQESIPTNKTLLLCTTFPATKKQYYKPRFLLMYYIFLTITENKNKYYIIYAFHS